VHLSPLVRDIIRADANYFHRNGFIGPRFYETVLLWLEGKKANKVVTNDIADWLDSDAKYFDELSSSLCRHHWYIYPLMWIMMKVVPRRLRAYASKIRKEG